MRDFNIWVSCWAPEKWQTTLDYTWTPSWNFQKEFILLTGILWVGHDDVIKWKIFRVTGPLWWESSGHQVDSPHKRPVMRSLDVFVFYLRPNKRLSKQSRRRWFETPSRSLWRHCNDRTKCFSSPIVLLWQSLHQRSFLWVTGRIYLPVSIVRWRELILSFVNWRLSDNFSFA